MFQQEVCITLFGLEDPRFLSQFVKDAKLFTSTITVTSDGKRIDAKSMFKLQTLNLTQGMILTISAEGQDEKKRLNI